MLLLLVIGITCLTACDFPNIKEPVNSCVISFSQNRFNCGLRDLNLKKENVGDWTDTTKNTHGGLESIPEKELVCFYTSDYLKQIKPTLKEGHAFWVDYTERNR